jgi:hypothetical protein
VEENEGGSDEEACAMYKTLGWYAWKLGCIGKGVDDTVVVTAPPRSGTTWLLEILEARSGVRRIWEPFHPGQSPETVNAEGPNFGLGLRPFLSPDAVHPELEQWMGDLLAGRLGPKQQGACRYGDISQLYRFLRARKTVVKFCRAQRLLPWITRRFPVRCLFLIRSPVATVASQLFHGSFQREGVDEEHPILSKQVWEEYGDLAQYASTLQYLEEKLAATWCFDHLIPSEKLQDDDNVRVVHYDDLVVRPYEPLRGLEGFLGLRFADRAMRKLQRPSATVVADSNVLKGRSALNTWRSRLSGDQCRRIADVVERFGVGSFDEEWNWTWQNMRQESEQRGLRGTLEGLSNG